MSLSHASPDGLLPETPESQGRVPEVPAVAADMPRQRFPFNARKILRTGGIVLLTLSLTGALTALVVMGRAMSDLTIRVNTLDAAFRSGQIGQLTTNVSVMEESLKVLERQVATLGSLPAAVRSAADEQASLKSSVQQMQMTDSETRQSEALLQTRISALEHDVQQSSAALDEIRRQLAQKAAEPEKNRAAPEPVKPRPAVAAKKTDRSARRVPMPAAPFVLTGIERRGGQTFAVVIPRGASQISAMRLLSPGDGFMGWTLRSVEGSRAAFFTVNGREHRLQAE
ncbi:plasmid transfer protein [Pantoea cypripedii]|uniref:Plasmid transfer protein n=1 Tax=Pantoea cypripedii TaxID=55209 RepID=A0A1X1EY34_PANCY|nr:plasmid transfer protein [Pantoea cypripedii]ORM94892.1 plasmid transfer protein [Pantoea cypripedii]